MLLDLEVQEAQAFLDGAQAAFNDLRLPLKQINPDETAAVDAALTRLDEALVATTKRTAIADPAQISAEADDATQAPERDVPPGMAEGQRRLRLRYRRIDCSTR